MTETSTHRFETPQAVAEGFVAAWNLADADRLTAVFTSDANFVNVVGLWFRGHRQIRYNHAYGFTHMFPDTTMTFDRVEVRTLGIHAAVVIAQWAMAGQVDPEGKPVGRRTGVLTMVTERQPDHSWLAVSAQNTDIAPGKQTNIVADGAMTATNYEED